MDINNQNIILVILGLVVSLLGNIAQYLWPTRKSKVENEAVISSTVKTIAEAYTMTLKSLQERIESLEEESEKDKETISLLRKQIEEQEKEIESLKEKIDSIQIRRKK